MLRCCSTVKFYNMSSDVCYIMITSIYDRLPLSDHLRSGMVVFTKSCALALSQAGYLQSSKSLLYQMLLSSSSV